MASPNSAELRRVFRQIDSNLKQIQQLCPSKGAAKDQGISEEVMQFRSKIQEWYTKLERSSPKSPHSLRYSGVQPEEEPASIPILSPVSSPQNDVSPPSFGRVEGQALMMTPETKTTSSCDSDGFPPTPKISATPSTCDVLGHKKKSRGGSDVGDVCRTPEFPTLTPAGLRVHSERKAYDSLSDASPCTPNLDSTPTTTIQLSPSHFILDNVLEGDGGAGISSQEQASEQDNVEEKLMNSLYIGSFSCQKVKSTQKSQPKPTSRGFDIEKFPAVFRSGNGSAELESVYRKVQKLETLRDRDISQVFPQFEKERVHLLLEVLSSRNYVECLKSSKSSSLCWRVL